MSSTLDTRPAQASGDRHRSEDLSARVKAVFPDGRLTAADTRPFQVVMARGAGEVAPLMITGVVKLAPEMPFDGHFPFLHLDRKFMHLGFHIYDVGFQSPNIEAAMVAKTRATPPMTNGFCITLPKALPVSAAPTPISRAARRFRNSPAVRSASVLARRLLPVPDAGLEEATLTAAASPFPCAGL